jgi:hypothetical protein
MSERDGRKEEEMGILNTCKIVPEGKAGMIILY